MNKIIAILADGKIVLSFFMRGYLLSPFFLIVRSFGQDLFGHLAKIRSVIWPRFVRSFGQVSFGRLAKSARYFSRSSKSISSDRLPSPLYIIYIIIRYMSLQPVGEVEVVEVDGDDGDMIL